MKYSFLRTASSLMLGSLVAFSAGSADAGWGHLGGSHGGSSGGSSGYVPSYAGSSGGSSGYSASYASYGSYGSSGGSSGGPGIVRGVLSHIHDHLAAKVQRHAARRAAYGSSGGLGSSGGSSGYSAYSYSSMGSSGGSSGYSTYYRSSYSGGSSGGAVSYGSSGTSSYGSSGSSYGSAGGVYYGASTQSTSSTGTLVSNTQTSDDAVYLTVNVPGNASVFVNGNATTSTGAVRQFVSRGLTAGKSYKFDIRAEVQGVDGQVMTEEKTVVVTTGQREQLRFAFAEDARPIETALTVNVPEGAKIILAGNETKATGKQRTFQTHQLKPGQVWDDYEVTVQLGDQVKRQSVRLIAGDNLQLSFDFSDDATTQVAAR